MAVNESHNSSLNAFVETTRRTFNLGCLLQLSTHYLVWWLYGAGCGVIFLKTTGYHEFFPPKQLFLTLIPVLLMLPFVFRKMRYSTMDAAAWLELKSHSGGRILASLDKSSIFTEELQTANAVSKHLPRITLRHCLQKAALPGIFFGLSFLIPGAHNEYTFSTRAIQKKADNVAEVIEEIRERETLPEEKLESFDEFLEEAQKAMQKSPETALEGIDNLRENIDRSLVEQAKSTLDNLEALQRMEADMASESKSEQAEAMEALGSLLKEMQKNPDKLSPALKNALAEACKNCGMNASSELGAKMLSSLSAAEIRELAESLREAMEGNMGSCKACAGLMSDAQARMAMEKLLGEYEEFNLEKKGPPMDGMAGRGGVDRGRGDAEMFFGDESDASGSRFKTKFLNPNDSGMIPGVTLAKTKVAPPETLAPEEFRPSARTGVGVDGKTVGSILAPELGPLNRKAAEKYFEAAAGKDD